MLFLDALTLSFLEMGILIDEDLEDSNEVLFCLILLNEILVKKKTIFFPFKSKRLSSRLRKEKTEY